MRRDCNLQLQLFPVSSSADSGDGGVTFSGRCPEDKQTMTMFFDGKVCVTDVTAFQARAILTLASKEMDEIHLGTPTGPWRSSPPGEMSMKRSLQQFLQKRRNRVRSTSPYNC